MTFEECEPGQRVRVLQTIDRREADWQNAVEGVVEQVDRQKTGSWYAHSKDGKFWLQRVLIRKDDGERSLLNIDEYTQIELVSASSRTS